MESPATSDAAVFCLDYARRSRALERSPGDRRVVQAIWLLCVGLLVLPAVAGQLLVFALLLGVTRLS